MYGKVGRQSYSAGTTNVLRTDADGNLVVSSVGPRWADWVDAERVFSVANQAVKSTTAALATTWTGLSVCNPSTSTVDLYMLEFGVAQGAAGAAGAIGLMIADTTGLAAELTPKNAYIGSSTASQAICDTAATCGTPILYRVFGSIGSVATTGYGAVPAVVYPIDGSLIIPPGYAVLSYTTGATTSALIMHFVWAEIDR